MKKFSPWYIVIGVLILLGFWVIGGYNGLIRVKADVDRAWADVETQYQRRADLVPSLVSTVKGAAAFEQSTLQNVIEARSAWAQARATGDRGQEIAAASNFDSALSRLLVTVEAYPQLQAVQAFRDLMTQLEGTENRVAVARRDYNAAVKNYSVKVQVFPGALIARLFGFAPEKSFDAAPGSEQAPKVDFNQ